MVLSCCPPTHCVLGGGTCEQNTHSWHVRFPWRRTFRERLLLPVALISIQLAMPTSPCHPPPTPSHIRVGSWLQQQRLPGQRVTWGNVCGKAGGERGACVQRLRRHWLAGSEVMQCSLNVATAEPASRVCLPISFSCLQLSEGQGPWGLLRPSRAVWLTGSGLYWWYLRSVLSLLFPVSLSFKCTAVLPLAPEPGFFRGSLTIQA